MRSNYQEASAYAAQHGIEGVYAYDQQDRLSGPVTGTWSMYASNSVIDPHQTFLGFNYYGFYGAHLYLELTPTAPLLQMVAGTL